MNRRTIVGAIFAILGLSAASGGAEPLVIEGLRPSYSDVAEVRFFLRNAGQQRVYLDSFLPDRFFVERQTDDGATWVRGLAWQCANAGAGSPRSLPPGGSLELSLVSSYAFTLEAPRDHFEAESGEHFPLHGRYRISAIYSVELWGSISQIPKHVQTSVSPVFEVRPPGR